MDIFDLIPVSINTGKLDTQLACCNNASSQYGLTLTRDQMISLEEQHIDLLQRSERVEFGTSSIVQLVEGFASSPYLQQSFYADCLEELQECFYRLRSIAGPDVFDDEIIDGLRLLFDGDAGGSSEALMSCTLEEVLEAYDTKTGSLEERQREIIDYEGNALEKSVPREFDFNDDFGVPAMTEETIERIAEAIYRKSGEEGLRDVVDVLRAQAAEQAQNTQDLRGPQGQSYDWNPEEWQEDETAPGWDGESWGEIHDK